MPHPLHIVDVFAERKHAGNQLAVVLDAGDLSSEEMQAIALETHFSETTFVTSREIRDGGFDVRIFTPGTELPFAGHPTLGTAWVLHRELLSGVGEKVVLNLKVGPIPVTFTTEEPGDPVLWMHQKPPVFGGTLPHAAVAEAVGLLADDLDSSLPAQEVSTGVYSLIVPVKSLDALARSHVERTPYRRLLADREARTVLLFCREARETGNQLAARVYADSVGIEEDPATGSACGSLAGYLVKHRVMGGEAIDLRVEQGYEMGRPSLLRLRAWRREDEIEIHVGGRVFASMRGELL